MSWTTKTAERRRIDAFELWCWKRLLRVPWTARRSNQSILKEISLGCSTGGTDVEAETPILWPPDAKSWLIWKERLRAEGEGEDRGWDGWMAPPTRWTWVWVDSGSWWWPGRPGVCGSRGRSIGHGWAGLAGRPRTQWRVGVQSVKGHSRFSNDLFLD